MLILECPTAELLDALQQQIISILEGGVPYWEPMRSKNESHQLERCLKTGLPKISNSQYTSFNHVLNLANIKSCKVRRLKLITSFAKKALQSDNHKHWFVQSDYSLKEDSRRRHQKSVSVLKPVQCRTQRYEHSTIRFLPKLIGWHPPLVYTKLELN